ncbi:MAG: ferrous iron transporter B [Ruminiclostridium sp.]|nr:ferrous iron transporter B [Ruminiclostridium sp.]
MAVTIALAGNPNCGKTTLFNALTGSNQFVGNWPGVTVEKKEGKMKKREDVTITDLPGIYSLSPYTLEEVVARNYLITERPDAILNIVDGTNLERNLYLTTQLAELGIPVVIAINMMDVVEKNGDKINTDELSRALGCKVVTISALKSTGITEAAELAVEAAQKGKPMPMHTFSGAVEHALAHIEEATVHDLPPEQQRWYSIKLFERDEKAIEQLNISDSVKNHIENDIRSAEKEMDDDAESIITNERYIYIDSIIKSCYIKKNTGQLTMSDKIDRVVTNRFAALPIFAVIMFLVYYLSISTVGTLCTDWMNDGVFGDGWHLLGIGSAEYNQALEEYAEANIWTDTVKETAALAAEAGVLGSEDVNSAIEDRDYDSFAEALESYGDVMSENGFDLAGMTESARENIPDTSDYGIWVPGIPILAENGLDAINCAGWLKSLLLDGIVAGVGAVLGFLPQMMVLFILLAFLEACGYMARIAFVMDKIFRKFGLSGKSFIPMLIGTGCGVPGIMASRTIENQRDRRMTIMTTTFIPCGAKLPIIALISSALFDGAWWVAPSAYFAGVAAIVISGIMLKKTKMFAGDPAPFVMELPAYHMPTFGNIMHSMWERSWSFIKKAGTIILLSSVIIWLGSSFGTYAAESGTVFGYLNENAAEAISVLDIIGGFISPIFAPLGFGTETAAVATIMGLVAKEEIVGVFGVLDFAAMTPLAGYSFLLFNLLCAPCFAAIGAIRREMNSARWTWFAIGYQCAFAYGMSLIVYQLGNMFIGNGNIFGILAAAAVLVIAGWLLFRKSRVRV